MKVYIVTEGLYSEYHIEKVFSDRTSAEVFCAVNNRGDRTHYYIEEYGIDDVEVDKSTKVKYRYLYFEHTNYKKQKYILLYNQSVEIDKGQVSQIYDAGYRQGVEVYMTEYDEKKAKKIARDIWAKYKAEKEGL